MYKTVNKHSDIEYSFLFTVGGITPIPDGEIHCIYNICPKIPPTRMLGAVVYLAFL